MSLKNQWNDPAKLSRAEMEAAAKESEKKFGSSRTVDPKTGKKYPSRYKLYEKLRERVSLRMMDVIIAVIVILIIAALVLGIFFQR